MSDRNEAKEVSSSDPHKQRNAGETQERILQAATDEFAVHGYDGARMERIVRNAGCNIRMAYHYFGGKEQLYLAALERVYTEIRQREKELKLNHLEPVEAMRRLVEFTFDHMLHHPEFTSLVRNENLLGGRMLEQSATVAQQTTPLVGLITDILARGADAGVFRRGVDPLHLYIDILSLSLTHISNRHTLSIIFQKDLADPAWLDERRGHAVEVILSCLEHRASE